MKPAVACQAENLPLERHPADEAQARLLIMEQSLISMTRYLKDLANLLEADLNLRKKHDGKTRPRRSKKENTGLN